ncbi:MAG: hypothetical protein OXC05_02575 [Halieaceae bacterium]|nr:hypothetical protein [Halieaceae bacterium]
MRQDTLVRALYREAVIESASPPYDHITLKVYYPAAFGNTDEERNSGVIPAVQHGAPFPVVLMFPGINVDPQSYAWLAKAMAASGLVFVTFSHIAEEMPGYVSLSPGLDLGALTPREYGSHCSATCLPSLLQELSALNRSGVLAGKLNLDCIVFGGHSAGGSVALFNARRAWCPGLAGCFVYGAHAGAATVLGWAEQSLMALPAEVPTLFMGGDQDGVIAASAHRYGTEAGHPTAIIERSFEQAGGNASGNCWLAIFKGANHFSCVWPQDDSTGRPYLDRAETIDGAELRESISRLTLDFTAAAVDPDSAATDRLQRHRQNPAYRRFANR